jgi:hypothetical protein
VTGSRRRRRGRRRPDSRRALPWPSAEGGGSAIAAGGKGIETAGFTAEAELAALLFPRVFGVVGAGVVLVCLPVVFVLGLTGRPRCLTPKVFRDHPKV